MASDPRSLVPELVTEPSVDPLYDPATDTQLVRIARDIMLRLAVEPSNPIVVMGAELCPDGTYELILRNPSRQELQRATMERFQAPDRSRQT